MNQKKYIFKKEYKTPHGNIPINTEIILFRGFVYMNGGMIHSAYANIFHQILNNPQLKNEYLREVNVIHNKI